MRHRQLPGGVIINHSPALEFIWNEQDNSITIRTYRNELDKTISYDQARALYMALFYLFGPMEFDA